MKKLLLICTCFVAILSALQAQVLYTTTLNGGINGDGAITKLVTGTNALTSAYTLDYPGGRYPFFSQVIQASNGKLYGMNSQGGNNGNGVIFSYDASAKVYTNVVYFNSSNGSLPSGSLVRAFDNKLYGMTTNGGSNNLGVIFSFDPSTNIFTKLYDFDGTNGSNPNGDLMQASNGKLYGMAENGGANNLGVIFSFDPSVNTYSKLLDFDGTNGMNPNGSLMQAIDGKLYGMTEFAFNSYGVLFSFDPYTNTYVKVKDFDGIGGAYPRGNVIQGPDGKLYGMTNYGGTYFSGAMFSYSPFDATYTKIMDFDGSNGSHPNGSLTRGFDNKLYGMTSQGGDNNDGIIFSYDLSGPGFTKLMNFNNDNGVGPIGNLMQALDGKLYGMTNYGGLHGDGVLFSFDPSSFVYTKLGNFGMNSTGSVMNLGLVKASDNKLYGATYNAGGFGAGTIFSFDPSNSSFTKLKDFDYTNGGNPLSLMQASDGMLYGMTNAGGSNGYGLIYSFDPVTRTYTDLKDFNFTDGSAPIGGLMQAKDGMLYGMTTYGGINGGGVLFSYDLSTNAYTQLRDFDDAGGDYPYGSLVEAPGGILYGTTYGGGSNEDGTIFSYDPSTKAYTKLHDFDGDDGIFPVCTLVLASDGKLYGTAFAGGGNGVGVLFSFDPATNAFTKLFDFGGDNGVYPLGSPMQASDGKLYGTATQGGSSNMGVAYSYDPVTSSFTKLADYNGTNGQYPYFTSFVEVSCSNPITWYRDADSDGHGNKDSSIVNCSQPAGYITDSTDCDDHDSTVYPGAPELCDGKDNNCNGVVDENCKIVKIKINDVTETEGNSGTKLMTFNVTLSSKSTQTVIVHYAAANETAKAPSDYAAKTGTLTFNPGIKKRTVNIKIKGDVINEPDETFKVLLSNPTNATLSDSIGIGTIVNDDALVTITKPATQGSSKQWLSVSPNPANNLVNVQLAGYTGKIALQLMDIDGKVLKESKLQLDNLKNAQQQFNIADIAGGTYYIIAVDEHGNKQSQKLVVTH